MREVGNAEPETFLIFRPAARDPSWRSGWVPTVAGERQDRLEDLPQSAFIWRNFRAHAEFVLGGADFSESGVPVCVLDFVLMLQAARTTMREDGSATLDLSDRVGEWVFDLRDDRVRLRRRAKVRDGYRYGAGDGSCTLDAFDELVDRSLIDALALIFAAQPALRRNPYLCGLAENAGSPGSKRSGRSAYGAVDADRLGVARRERPAESTEARAVQWPSL